MSKIKSTTKLVLNFILAAAALSSFCANADPKDKKSTQDHPLIERFPDTHIQSQKIIDFERVHLATGPLTPELKSARGKDALPPVNTVEGKIVSTHYRANSKETSALRVYKSYESALKKAGFNEVFSCESDQECGKKFVVQLYYYGDQMRQGQHPNLSAPNIHRHHKYFYWSGTGQSDGQDYGINLLVAKRNTGDFAVDVVLDIVKIEGMSLEDIKIDLSVDSMTKSISETGRVVLDGIFFDFDKATLTPASETALTTIAEFLKANPNDKYYVVGHTDMVGGLEHNRNLSKLRAQAVANYLSSRKRIPYSRFLAIGVGPVSPIASNATDASRSLNRRVELVLMQ